MDSDISKYPVLEWYPGERIELVYRRGRLHEVVFKTLFRSIDENIYFVSVTASVT